MKTVYTLEAFQDLDSLADETANSYLTERGLENATVKSIKIEEELSCDMAATYWFIFSYTDEDGDWETTGHITFFANGAHMVQLELDEHESHI